MAYVTMNKARVLQCNETGKLAIQTGPGQELIPLDGGGVSSWNDLKDKPFGEEDVVPIFDEEVDFTEYGLYEFTKPLDLSDGKTYIAFINDVEVRGIAEYDSDEECTVVDFYTEDEDCVLYALPFNMSRTSYLPNGVYRIKIFEGSPKILRTIDPKYLPQELNTELVIIENYDDSKNISLGDDEIYVEFWGEGNYKYFSDAIEGKKLCQRLADTNRNFKFVLYLPNGVSVYRDYLVNANIAYPLFKLGDIVFGVEEL